MIVHREPINLPEDFSWKRFETLPEVLKEEMSVIVSRQCNQAIEAGKAAVGAWPPGKVLSWETKEEQRVVEFFWEVL